MEVLNLVGGFNCKWKIYLPRTKAWLKLYTFFFCRGYFLMIPVRTRKIMAVNKKTRWYYQRV